MTLKIEGKAESNYYIVSVSQAVPAVIWQGENTAG